MIIKKFNKFVNETLTINQYRKYNKVFNREKHKDIFLKYKDIYKDIVPPEFYEGVNREAYRIYLPYISETKKSDTQLEIENVLKKNGFDVNDPKFFELGGEYNYITGNFKFPGSKNPSKLGKILNKLKRPDLNDKFAGDKTRSLANKKRDDYVICISRHAYDVAGADTDRRWNNCMTLFHYNRYKKIHISKGQNVRYLLADIKEGTIVAFLIKMSDIDKDPLKDAYANINIKVYYNEDNPSDFVLMPDNRIYGIADPKFKEIVFDWCEVINGNKKGYYKMSDKLYHDNFKRIDADAEQQFKDEDDEEDEWEGYAKKYLPDDEKINPIDIAGIG